MATGGVYACSVTLVSVELPEVMESAVPSKMLLASQDIDGGTYVLSNW